MCINLISVARRNGGKAQTYTVQTGYSLKIHTEICREMKIQDNLKENGAVSIKRLANVVEK